jgi:hypothetical protein
MRLLAIIGFLGIAAAIGAAVFFFGGYYSVAGTAEEPAIVKWALIQVRTASIAKHATANPPMPFDAGAVTAGARAYATRGCVYCHGGPGADWAKFSEGLRPDPPDLKDVVKDRAPAHLFWVIKNGINMTGMPSFAMAGVPDPEIWQIVAFLKKLPEISEADYKSWTAPPMEVLRPPADIPPAPIPNPPAPEANPPAPETAPKPPN